ncbi:MAG: 2-dehydropantoate 2-reductase [Rhodoferax sp.]
MGAGAVGCYFGGLLARAGCAVTLIGRAPHVQAMQQQGLRLQLQSSDETIAVTATEDVGAVAQADVVLLAVKSADTESSGALMRPHLAPGASVLCLQNGVDNAQRLRAVLPGVDVLACAVYVATEMAGPGHLLHHGRGELVLESGPRSAVIAQALASAGIPTEVRADVLNVLWTKLTINCAYNGLSAIGQIAYGALMQHAQAPQALADLVAECQAVAAADGITLPNTLDAAVRDIARSMATQRSSTAHDLRRGRPTEIDHLNGYVVRRGEALGIPTPANRMVWLAVRLLQARA